MWTSAVGGSRARSSVSTQLEATDVRAETASGSPETVAPVRASPLLLLLRPPTPRQQWVVPPIWVNPCLLLGYACFQDRGQNHGQPRAPLLLLVRAMPLSTRTVSNNALRLVPTPDGWLHAVRRGPLKV